ncbi:histidine phosphatase family protein [Kitasatospora sp. NPDC088351]|uniref:SixA phosphatase family protein n=1 Tax=unclassified Kitasatospora TaxID=2633591 RepID=UPI0034243EDD
MTTDATRRIIVVRHARAERETQVDHERHLDDQGRTDAPLAGRWLAGSGLTPGLARVSDAVRTRETWELMAQEFPEKPAAGYEEALYTPGHDEGGLGGLIALVNGTSDEVNDLLVVGHNPEMHALADTLAGEAEGDLRARMERSEFPTAAVAVLAFSGSWKSLGPGSARLVGYWTPQG